jgi:hypothetical protein
MRDEPKDPQPSSPERREFLRVTTAAVAGMLASRVLPDGALAARAQAEAQPAAAALATRKLGRIGYEVKLFSLGGQAAIEKPDNDEAAVAIVERALDLGVNYVDTAARYGKGVSQRYIGKVMKHRRKEVFLASKTHDRTRDGSLRLLEESLRVLETDHLDLWQLHNMQTDAEVDQVFARGGAMEAFEQARLEGMVRFLGITGHYDPDVLVRAVSRYPFDTILMALNAADRYWRPFTETLLPLANAKRMGIIAMKIPGRGRVFRAGGLTAMSDAMNYVLSLAVNTVIVGCDTVQQLEENVAIASRFRPLPDTEMRRIEGLTASYASDASWFKRG